MHTSISEALLLVFLAIPASLSAQTVGPTSTSATPQRDQQGTAILQQSVLAMAGAVPSDSVATGNVVTVAGGQNSQGNIQILTKGVTQTSVQMAMPDATRSTIYSNGQANNSIGGVVSTLSLELAVTTQASEFPLPLLAAMLQDPDTSIQYVGLESSNSHALYHVRVWDSFATKPDLLSLARVSARDVWIDSVTALPQHISYTRLAAQGAVPGIAVDVFYVNYQNHAGILYPSVIQESLDGTPWASINIQNVSFNTGLTDSSFPIE
jgi:hypothetical protein